MRGESVARDVELVEYDTDWIWIWIVFAKKAVSPSAVLAEKVGVENSASGVCESFNRRILSTRVVSFQPQHALHPSPPHPHAKKNANARLLSLFIPEPGFLVDDVHVELRRTFHDRLAVQGGHVVRDFRAVPAVVHHKKVKVRDVVDNKLQESVGKKVARLLVRAVTHVGVGGKALELTPVAAIDTAGLSPGLLLVWQKKRRSVEGRFLV